MTTRTLVAARLLVDLSFRAAVTPANDNEEQCAEDSPAVSLVCDRTLACTCMCCHHERHVAVLRVRARRLAIAPVRAAAKTRRK